MRILQTVAAGYPSFCIHDWCGKIHVVVLQEIFVVPEFPCLTPAAFCKGRCPIGRYLHSDVNMPSHLARLARSPTKVVIVAARIRLRECVNYHHPDPRQAWKGGCELRSPTPLWGGSGRSGGAFVLVMMRCNARYLV